MTIKEIKQIRNHLEQIELPNKWICIAEELLKPENLRLSTTALQKKLKVSRYTINLIFEYLQMYLKEKF